MITLPSWITPNVKQIWIASSTLLNKLSVGMAIGFTTCLLDDLNAPESTIKLTLELESSSWIASSLFTGVIFSFFTSSLMITFLGRRTGFILQTIPGIIGMILIAFAADVPSLIAGRALLGFSSSNGVVGAIIIGEYCSPQNRGMFLNMKNAAYNIGSVLVHILGKYLHWRTVAGITMVPLVLCFLIICASPESPCWLAEQKQFEKSEEVFYWLRGETEESTKEIKDLIQSQNDKKTNTTFSERIADLKNKLKMKNFWLPMVIVITISILVEVSGRHIFSSYAAQITKGMLAAHFDPFYLY